MFVDYEARVRGAREIAKGPRRLQRRGGPSFRLQNAVYMEAYSELFPLVAIKML